MVEDGSIVMKCRIFFVDAKVISSDEAGGTSLLLRSPFEIYRGDGDGLASMREKLGTEKVGMDG